MATTEPFFLKKNNKHYTRVTFVDIFLRKVQKTSSDRVVFFTWSLQQVSMKKLAGLLKSGINIRQGGFKTDTRSL